MDLQARNAIRRVVDKWTSPKSDLFPAEESEELLKEFKTLVKQSDDTVTSAFQLCMAKMAAKKAGPRLKCLALVDQLFMRSKLFRQLLVAEIKPFLELAVGTRHEKPLPPPAEDAQSLREESLECIERWNELFGDRKEYHLLRLAYQFLKNTLRLPFPDRRGEEERLRDEEERRAERYQRVLRVRFASIVSEFQQVCAEVETLILKTSNTMELLVPSSVDSAFPQSAVAGSSSPAPSSSSSMSSFSPFPSSSATRGGGWRTEMPPPPAPPPVQAAVSVDGEDEEWEDDWDLMDDSVLLENSSSCGGDGGDDDDDYGGDGNGDGAVREDRPVAGEDMSAEDMRHRGIASRSYELRITINTDEIVRETEQNALFFDALKECATEISNIYLPKLEQWMATLSSVRFEGEGDSQQSSSSSSSSSSSPVVMNARSPVPTSLSLIIRRRDAIAEQTRAMMGKLKESLSKCEKVRVEAFQQHSGGAAGEVLCDEELFSIAPASPSTPPSSASSSATPLEQRTIPIANKVRPRKRKAYERDPVRRMAKQHWQAKREEQLAGSTRPPGSSPKRPRTVGVISLEEAAALHAKERLTETKAIKRKSARRSARP